jgi:hypothetical protein
LLLAGYGAIAYAFRQFPFSPYATELYDGKVFIEAYVSGAVITCIALMGWYVLWGLSERLSASYSALSNLLRVGGGFSLLAAFVVFAHYLTLLLFFGVA